MRSALIACGLASCLAMPAFAQQLYRHVDKNGKITFADRPQEAHQKAEKPKPVNVESPEVRRQMHYQLQERDREEHAERMAQRQRYYSYRQRELEQEREQRAREADPYSPPQAPYRPRANR